jgi:hypothetical protein
MFSTKTVSFKVVYSLKIYRNTKFHGPRSLAQVFIHPSSLKVRHFGMVKDTVCKYGVEVKLNGLPYQLSFIKSTDWFKS